jgi:hypothetical protein
MRAFTAAVFALAVCLVSWTARAENGSDRRSDDDREGDFDECSPVNAPIVTTFFLDGCTSPFGICTRGTIDSGPLEGTTSFAVFSLQPGPSPELLVYTGSLLIQTENGAVSIKDRGILNTLDGTFFELDQIVGGTQAFSDATGLLFSHGVSTATGFQGTIAGQVCGGPPADPLLDGSAAPATLVSRATAAVVDRTSQLR